MAKGPEIIIKKVKKKGGHGGGHHGGAWKVAYADFVTAMMALFLVLWLVAVMSVESKAALAQYFRSYTMLKGIEAGGAKGISVMKGAPIQLDDEIGDTETGKAMRESLQLELAAIIEKELINLKDQVLMHITKDGVRIELVEKFGSPMFKPGGAELSEDGEIVLNVMAVALMRSTAGIVIEGHTDGHKFMRADGYSNWELAADRANAARRALIDGGIVEQRIIRVASFGDSSPLNFHDPYDPKNRRVSILVLLDE